MIARYSRPEMSAIWSDTTRFELWLDVELLALEAMAERGDVPSEAARVVRAKAKIDPQRILEIESQVKHDVIAFLTNVAESVGPEARYVHRGMTSNDMLDTAFALQLVKSSMLIIKNLDGLLSIVKQKALEFENTVCVGRSHGMHAEPITFGLKLASWYSELLRQKSQLQQAQQTIAVGKISGPVGVYGSISPEIEKQVLSKLGLVPETVATQVVARDRHATFFTSLALLGSSIERFCVEIRHLQRSEVGEVEEPFGSGQKGSSAMPHKKNPILSENLVGLSRLLRGYAQSAMENVALWHERDISHSSVERVIAPDACIITDFMLARFTSIVVGLVVHADRMKKNLESSNGLVYSGGLLIALTDAGVTREQAYAMVQRHALATTQEGPSLKERVLSDSEFIAALGKERITELCDVQHHLRHVRYIMNRALSR